MKDTKFSLFDFLAFFLPGAVFIYPFYKLNEYYDFFKIDQNNESFIDAVIFIFIAYLIGHFISQITKYLLLKTEKEEPHIEFLKKNPSVAADLNIAFKYFFEKSLLNKKGEIDETIFLQNRTNLITTITNNYFNKTSGILEAQKVFFRNVQGLMYFLIIPCVGISIYNNSEFYWSILIAIVLLVFAQVTHIIYKVRKNIEAEYNISSFITLILSKQKLKID